MHKKDFTSKSLFTQRCNNFRHIQGTGCVIFQEILDILNFTDSFHNGLPTVIKFYRQKIFRFKLG